MNKINRLIYCIIDDVRSKQFFNWINRGILPNFKRLMENGLYCKNCITDFPSVTFPTQISMITGTHTGDYRNELCHGVPNYNWMDRSFSPPLLRNYGSKKLDIYQINQDLGCNCKTILEMFPEDNTASITQFINRGTKYHYPETKLKLIILYLLLNHYPNLKNILKRANSLVVQKLLRLFTKPSKFFNKNDPPVASLLWFMSSDIIMHLYGANSFLYKLNLKHIDKVIGYLLKDLEKLGYLDETAIVITSDHGNYNGKTGQDLLSIFHRVGLKNYHPRANPTGNMNIAEFGGLGFFYFKGENVNSRLKNTEKWSLPTIKELKSFGPKKINLLKYLFRIPGTKLMYYGDEKNTADNGVVYLKRKLPFNGKIITGKIEYRGSGKDLRTKYLCYEGEEDIFGYKNHNNAEKLVNNRFYSYREWMDATHLLDYPLYPDLLVRHFKNPRSADLIISTQGERVYNIVHGKQKEKGVWNHDIGLRKSSIVPLIIGGTPEIPKKHISYCSIVDIVPTLMKLIGKNPHHSVMGLNLI
ncbi:MAG: Type I phosphodiesterase / nucleotide pyrophosphatase [Promethearchaeota archaeon]|nr:MAG: Type I phosphodiesterase / nucleotide pyrophosphatase [Candidatus Lokiarchaeota archaeon]